ncbi:MAG TPA: hypothetical protein VGM19_09745 [Armatimonadota bacterium]
MQEYTYQQIPNWSHLRGRYLANWEHRVEDGAILAHIQNPAAERPAPEPWMLEASAEKYLNPEKLFDLGLWRHSAWRWHADLFQYCTPSYGPNVFLGFCGVQPVFGADTVWHEPLISSLDEADRVHFDEDNPYWKTHLETVAYFSERCAGQMQLGGTDLGGPADWISAVMGTENFLIESLERPDEMRDFALRLAAEGNRAYDLLYPLLTAANDGLANWMPCWWEGRLVSVGDDMAINFSPALYRDVFLPALQLMAGLGERTVLHWHDGCRQHLDSVLSLDEIDLIQFGHDPNSPPFTELIPQMQQIQAAGKCLFISCVEAWEVPAFLAALDPRGLSMIINTADDEASARMQDTVAELTTRRLTELGLD